MIAVILEAAGSFAFPPLCAFVIVRVGPLSRTRERFLCTWAGSGAGGATSSAFAAARDGGWPVVAGFAASGLFALILWWWSRRKRKRSLRALGAKAKARLAAMVKNMPKPGPVLRPVPQGA